MSIASTSDRTILVKHPAAFREQPLRTFALVVLLGLATWLWGLTFWSTIHYLSAVVAALPLLVLGLLLQLYIGALFTKLTVTEDRVILRKGIISKRTSELRHRDIRAIEVKQSILERLFNVGRIGISSSGQSDLEIVIGGIVDPQSVAQELRSRQQVES